MLILKENDEDLPDTGHSGVRLPSGKVAPVMERGKLSS
jgi:hypothetical protein